MIEHAIVAVLAIALFTLLNSRVHWHFHYKVKAVNRSSSNSIKEKRGEIDRIPEHRAVPSRPYRSTPERIADRTEELIASALVNLGAGKKEALQAAQAAIAGCPSKDFDSRLRFALGRKLLA